MKLLLLAGTGQSRRIAEELHGEPGIEITASLAGVTRQPAKLPCQTRIGGFGGASGLAAFIQQNQIKAVIDATHPFAVQISATAKKVCDELAVARVQVLRPPWSAGEGDNWVHIDREYQARDFINPGSTVFLATGRQTLARFENLSSCYLICRQIDPPDKPFPFPNGEYLVGAPPFSVRDEVDLFRAKKIDWLVVKNSGAMASFTKMEAARQLEIPVLMINRPAQPDGLQVETVAGAVKWAKTQRGEI